MKKVVFSVFALLLVCVAFGQKTDQEIYKIIQMSKEANAQKHGISDPNKIWIGQALTFRFKDGSDTTLTVESGDNQWKMIRNKVSHIEKFHGPVIPWNDSLVPISWVKGDSVAVVSPVVPVISSKVDFPWIAVIGIILLLFIIWLIFFLLKRSNKLNADPITAGPPQIEGGVNDASAHSRMEELIQSRFPGAGFQIRNIRRGRLSGLAEVHYASGDPKKLRLNDQPAYAGEIIVNDHEETIYFLQGCGNDARIGNYMSGELIFTPDVIVNEDGSTNPVFSVPVVEQLTTEAPIPPAPVDVGSEFHQHTAKALEIFENVLKGEEVKHKLSIKITHDSFEAVVENKFDQPKKSVKSSAEEKK